MAATGDGDSTAAARASIYAQFESASVLGYVRDSTSAAVPNSTVTLTNVATSIKQTATTDAEGRYEFSSVPIGRYEVATEATGFQRTETPPFTVTTNARQRVDVTVKPGSVNETVTVSSAPTILETETSSRGQVIGTREIENLPLNGRSYADLALLAPGVRKSFLENSVHNQPRSIVQCERPAQRIQQLSAGWSGQQLLRNIEPGICERKYSSIARCGLGVSAGDGQLQRRVWPGIGRCDQRLRFVAAPTSFTAGHGTTTATPSSMRSGLSSRRQG